MTFATKADANAWLAAQQTDTGRGTWVDPSLGEELFGDYARKWLDSRSDLGEPTRAKFQGLLGLHILPAFGRAGSPRSTPPRSEAGTTPFRPSTKARATTPTACSGPL